MGSEIVYCVMGLDEDGCGESENVLKEGILGVVKALLDYGYDRIKIMPASENSGNDGELTNFVGSKR